MEAHWTKCVEACSECREQFSYGTGGEEFCANSSCHDRRWQNMPIQLKPEGAIKSAGRNAE